MKGRDTNYVLISKALIPLCLLLCLAAHQLCFKKTIDHYQRYVALKGTENSSERLSLSPAYSISREKAINHLFGRFLVDTVRWKNELWNRCAVLSRQFNCAVDAFPELQSTNPALQSGFLEQHTMFSQEIVFNGGFHNLLSLQHALDTIKNIGVLGGLSYHRNPRALNTTLKLRLFALSDRRER